MRVAILGSRGIPAKYGAFEITAERLGIGLVDRGWDVTVYCPHNQSYQEPDYNRIKLRYVFHPPGGPGTLVYDVLSFASASRGDFDALLMLGYGASPFLRIPRFRGVPTVVNTNGIEWKRSKWPWYAKRWFRYAERSVTRLADQLVSDSKGIQRYYRETYGVHSAYVAYGTECPDLNGNPEIDLSAFGLRPKEYYIVVMRMEPENSIREIVQGFLASSSLRKLLLVGPPTRFFEEEVRPLFERNDRIVFCGAIYDRGKVFSLRQNAYAYIHGHTVGGTNPSLLEAMASGNFVIARNVEFSSEVIGDLGRYFDTPADLARLIDELDATDSAGVQRKGLEGRRRIEEDFQWDLVIDAYVRVLVQAVRRAGGARSEIGSPIAR